MSKTYNVITLIMRFTKKIGRDRVRAHAAEAAFFIIMSVFPILMLLLTLLRYTTLTTEQIIFTIFNQSTALVPWTALVAVWTAGKGILGLSDGLNSIFQIEETKNYFVTRFRCACYTVVMVLALTVSLFILVFGYSIETYLLKKIPLLTAYQDELTVLPTSVALLILLVLFTVLYTFLPNRRMRFFHQIPGAVFTAVSWGLFSYVFAIYLKYAGNMSVLYGSLTTLIVVMLWLYSCMYLLFIGAEINHYLVNPEMFPLDR